MTGRRRPWLRAGLLFFAVAQAVVGTWALALPRAFVDNFPAPGHHWVALLPPYNEHLVFDYGALTLSMAVTLAVAGLSMDRLLVRTALASALVFAVPHFVFHVFHLAGFPPAEAVAQMVTLTVTLALAIGLLVLALVEPRAARVPPPAGRARDVT